MSYEVLFSSLLFTIPGPEVPDWLGGLRLGGPVSAEGLAWAVVRGMVILPIFLAFGGFVLLLLIGTGT